MIGRVWRRLRQGWLALLALVRPLDYGAVAEVLSPELLALFRRMHISEQHHSLRVMQTLRAAGHTHPDLLTAALLHDAGKSRHPFTLFERTLVVLARKALPTLSRRWGQGEPHGWRRPFVIAECHPQWSAEDMAAAGASPLAVELARRHQTPLEGEPESEADHLLSLLQEADNAN